MRKRIGINTPTRSGPALLSSATVLSGALMVGNRCFGAGRESLSSIPLGRRDRFRLSLGRACRGPGSQKRAASISRSHGARRSREIPHCSGRPFRRSERGRKNRPAPFGMTGRGWPRSGWNRGRVASRTTEKERCRPKGTALRKQREAGLKPGGYINGARTLQ